MYLPGDGAHEGDAMTLAHAQMEDQWMKDLDRMGNLKKVSIAMRETDWARTCDMAFRVAVGREFHHDKPEDQDTWEVITKEVERIITDIVHVYVDELWHSLQNKSKDEAINFYRDRLLRQIERKLRS